jgi:hypothetical protein
MFAKIRSLHLDGTVQEVKDSTILKKSASLMHDKEYNCVSFSLITLRSINKIYGT